MSEQLKTHWENIYATKTPDEVSWTQEIPQTSLDFLGKLALPPDARIIDVGGGDSKLVDYLIQKGYTNVSVLDISAHAIERAKKRLGDKASLVNWIISDINDFNPEGMYDWWHDRAAFHFLTDEKAIAQYVHKVAQHAHRMLIGTFSVDGPLKCSGLPITQYSESTMQALFQHAGFVSTGCERVNHTTPMGTTQNFLFCSFVNTTSHV
ncbi:MAG: class I SAM-dependent methyltransferase [Bacteroidia bacterium]|nr:class I SAM-dependent methyltransferase [Bacteroidia bacterium]